MNYEIKSHLVLLTLKYNYVIIKKEKLIHKQSGGIVMRVCITPNDADVVSKTDSESIQRAVDLAKKTGINKVVIPAYNERTGKNIWEIDKAIVLESDIEIVLDNSYLIQKEGCFDNVFRNFNDDAMRKSFKEEQHNIHIRGVGNAVIDGGKHNGLTEANSSKNGMPNISVNNVIKLHNLRGFSIEGITIKNQRWWAINLIYCEQGKISDLNIIAENNVPNQDGIDLRIGCHDIIIENIFGQSGDDFIALSGFWGGSEANKYEVYGKSKDIHDIIIKNIIATSADCAVIALRNHDGVRLYNVSIDKVYDTLNGNENNNVYNYQHLQDCRDVVGQKSPYAVVRINQYAFWNNEKNKPGETYGINITNIYSRCNAAVMINGSLENSYIGNIYANGVTNYAITTKSDWSFKESGQTFGADMKNVVIENIFFNSASKKAVVLDFDISSDEHITKDNKVEKNRMYSVENVIIKNVFCGAAKTALNMQHNGSLNIEKLFTAGDMNINKNVGSVFLDGEKVI